MTLPLVLYPRGAVARSATNSHKTTSAFVVSPVAGNWCSPRMSAAEWSYASWRCDAAPSESTFPKGHAAREAVRMQEEVPR